MTENWSAIFPYLARRIAVVFLCLAAFMPISSADQGGWQRGHEVRSRLVAAMPQSRDPEIRLVFFQIEMSKGWKTYWRHPGDGGGIPPRFDWQGSENLKSARVLYPAPLRLKESFGDSIGYKDGVIFPIELQAVNRHLPIQAKLNVHFGICETICVPQDAAFSVFVPVDAMASPARMFIDALSRVPKAEKTQQPDDPSFANISQEQQASETWRIVLSTKHSEKSFNRDLFLEAPGGIYIPVPTHEQPKPETKDQEFFSISLTNNEYKALKGKKVRATIVDNTGAVETEITIK